MKKYFIILSFCLIFCQLSGQDSIKKKWNPFDFKHEVSLGIGDPYTNYFYTYPYYSSYLDIRDSYGYLLASNWITDESFYRGDTYSTCNITAGYMYRIKKWFWVGGTFSYCGFFSNYYSSYTAEKVGMSKDHIISILPTIRFSYLNKKYVTLYSQVALGVNVNLRDHYYSRYKFNDVTVAGQLTFIGVSAGKKWFGFAELGIGNKGFINAGFGYRFSSKCQSPK